MAEREPRHQGFPGCRFAIVGISPAMCVCHSLDDPGEVRLIQCILTVVNMKSGVLFQPGIRFRQQILCLSWQSVFDHVPWIIEASERHLISLMSFGCPPQKRPPRIKRLEAIQNVGAMAVIRLDQSPEEYDDEDQQHARD
jgi:hypothetical protein